jgi:glycosyltransferase involved in cell wall biosynthesis
MGSRVEVSVVIPTRDRQAMLPRALEVSLGQENVALEVIVVDDGSRDGTPEILRSARDPRLKVVTHGTSRGVAAARNAGIERADGEWLAFLDDDDVWSPHKLRRQLDIAGAQGALFAYAAAVDLDERGDVSRLDRPPPPEDLLRRLLRFNVIPAGSSNVLAHTGLVRETGGFDERLSQAADWELWIRFATAGRAASCEEVLVGYSLHSGNMLLAEPKRISRELSYIAAKHRLLAETLQVSLDRSAYFRWVATGHRRAGRRLPAAAGYVRAAATGGGRRDLVRAVAALAGQRMTVAVNRRLASSGEREILDVKTPPWLERYGLVEAE